MKQRIISVGSLLAGVLAGAGLVAVIYTKPPTPFWTVVALGLIIMVITAATTPLWRRVLRRLTPTVAEHTIDIMGFRFGLWSGIFVASIVLLKIMDFLDGILILAILALLIMLEMFLQQNNARKRPSRRRRR